MDFLANLLKDDIGRVIMIPGTEEAFNWIASLPGGQATLAAVIFIVGALVFYSVAMLIIKIFRKVSSKTETTLDDILADKVRRPLKLISIVLAAFIAVQVAYPGSTIAGYSSFEVFKVLLMFAAVIFVDGAVDGVLMWYGKEIAPKTESKFDDEIFPLFRKIARVLVYVMGILIILSELNVEIAPLIAGLGIAGLAVALALQDTLSNFFSGVYMLADKPIKPGDYIKIEGTEVAGTVIEVGWRSTKILTWANNYVFVPNSKVAQSIITNYYDPEQKMGVVMVFSASYDDDPDKVVEALLEAANVVAEKTGKVHSPWARPDAFGGSSVDYKDGMQVPQYTDSFGVKGAMVREVYYKFKEKGITIPFPTRTILMDEEEKEVKIKKKGKAK
jgi:small-conductance mechanosensitive channel